MTIQPRHTHQANTYKANKDGQNSEESLTVSELDNTLRPSGKKPPNLPDQEAAATRSETQSSLMKWFYQLPIRRKQLSALLTSELLSVLGLVGVGSVLIIVGGRTQLANQAKAEVNVSRITYNTRIDQMEFGLRGQAENPVIVTAAKEAATSRGVSVEARQQIRNTLANEVSARNIEYATLVGTDLRIISNANADRVGQRFDPDGLVSAVLANSKPLQASTLVRGAELQKESPPSAAGLANQDALIRYVLIPVRNPETQAVIGVLVAGDVVKQPIVKDTLAALGDGYSAVYQRSPSGDFVLATSLDLGSGKMEQARTNIKLSDERILQQAADSLKARQAFGEAVVQRVDIDGRTNTVAAEPIANIKGQPVGVLVRGTPEVALNNMLRNSLALQLGIASLALLGDFILARLLGRSIANPVENLRRTTQKFAEGDRQARADVFAYDEVGELAVSFNNLAASVSSSEKRLQNQASYQQLEAERATLMAELTGRMRQHNDRAEIFAVVTQEVRKTLAADRVVVYLLDSDGSGKVVSESVEQGYPIALDTTITDPCFTINTARVAFKP
jgi:twitching motility protein PilJ